MNAKANQILESLREKLESQLNLQTEDVEIPDVGLTEAEAKFCEDGIAFIQAAQYELEGHEGCGPEQIRDALVAIAEDDENLEPKVVEFFKLHKELFAA